MANPVNQVITKDVWNKIVVTSLKFDVAIKDDTLTYLYTYRDKDDTTGLTSDRGIHWDKSKIIETNSTVQFDVYVKSIGSNGLVEVREW